MRLLETSGGPKSIGSRFVEKLPIVRKRKEEEQKKRLLSEFLTKTLADIGSNGYTIVRHFENSDSTHTTDTVNNYIFYTSGERSYGVQLTAVEDILDTTLYRLIFDIDEIEARGASSTDLLKRGRISATRHVSPSKTDPTQSATYGYDSERFYVRKRTKLDEQTTVHQQIQLSTAETIDFLTELLGCQVDAQATRRNYEEAEVGLPRNAAFFNESQEIYWNNGFQPHAVPLLQQGVASI